MSKESCEQGCSEDGQNRQSRTVVVLELAKDEGRDILNDGQYWHVVEIIRRLADFGDEEELWDLRIEQVEDFYELKLKGGLIGNINLRVYFADVSERNEVVVLKTYKKEQEGKVPRYIIINLEDRLSNYLTGLLRDRVTVYRSTKS